MTTLDRQLHQLNESGTHVLTTTPTGDDWWCPVDYWPFAEAKGFELVASALAEVTGPGAPVDPETVNEPPLADFDPSTHNVEGPDGVNAYLAEQHAAGNQAEIDRVLALEKAGQNRKSVQSPTAG